MTELKLFNRSVTLPAASNERCTFLLWGKSSCGKTALASTLPAPILWLGFDADGEQTIANHPDVQFVKLSDATHDLCPMMMEGESYERQLDDYLKQSKPASLVIDSMTSFSQLALTHSVVSGKASGKSFKATMDVPGMSGYGVRNRIVLSATRMLLRVTSKHNTHCMFICHEDSPDKNDEGKIIRISLLLGGTLPAEMPLQISEVWYMRDENGRRELFMRPFGVIQPMRTRMFRTDTKSSMVSDYNMYTGTGTKIRDLIAKWREGGPGFKLPIG